MGAISAKHTKPELRVRRAAHALGYRFRLHRRDLPGNPDLVFPKLRLALFVHGCFWHQHPGCRRAVLPATRPDYWLPKLARNQTRDATARAALEAAGWHVAELWECALSTDAAARAAVANALAGAEEAPSGWPSRRGLSKAATQASRSWKHSCCRPNREMLRQKAKMRRSRMRDE